MPMSDRTKGMLTGVAVGIGIAVLYKAFSKPLAEAARPLTKAGMRTLLEAREKGTDWLAETGETLSDLVAEVRAEREAERAEALAAARTGARTAGSAGGDT